MTGVDPGLYGSVSRGTRYLIEATSLPPQNTGSWTITEEVFQRGEGQDLKKGVKSDL